MSLAIAAVVDSLIPWRADARSAIVFAACIQACRSQRFRAEVKLVVVEPVHYVAAARANGFH